MIWNVSLRRTSMDLTPLSPEPEGRPLFIGSLPFQDHGEALEELLKRCPESPNWIQLPSNPREGFLVQFTEGLPGFRTDPRPLVLNQGEEFQEELLRFYEAYLEVAEAKRAVEESLFQSTPEAVPGLYKLLELLEAMGPVKFVKGQISGPLTILLALQDSSGRLAYYDERVRDAAVRLLAMRARWQTRKLVAAGGKAIVFVDEPALGHVGSSVFIGVELERALRDLKEILLGIEDEGGWPGIHVCANADWGTILGVRGLRVLSFDAFSYFERFSLFKEEILGFLERGGIIAWGIVPTDSHKLDTSTVEDLAELWIHQAGFFFSEGLQAKDLLARSFITPSCGLGSLDKERALRAMDLTASLSQLLRGKFLCSH